MCSLWGVNGQQGIRTPFRWFLLTYIFLWFVIAILIYVWYLSHIFNKNSFWLIKTCTFCKENCLVFLATNLCESVVEIEYIADVSSLSWIMKSSLCLLKFSCVLCSFIADLFYIQTWQNLLRCFKCTNSIVSWTWHIDDSIQN
jgi:hypothetical protein